MKPHWSGVGAIAAVLLAAAGCVLPPKNDPQLQTVEPAALGLSDAAVLSTQTEWWHDYGDPQFDSLIESALARNPTLQQTLARVRRAQAQVQSATGGRGPDYSLTGDEIRQRYSEHFIYPPPYAGGTYWQGALRFNFSWDLDLWGEQSALIDQAQAGLQAANLDAAAARLTTTVALSQAYLDFSRAVALSEVARRTVEQRERVLDITQKRIDAGLDTRVELREAQAAVPQAQLLRLQADAARDLAVHRLAALTGEGAGTYDLFRAPTLNLDTALPVPDSLPADLLGRRPDILAARARVDAAIAGRAAARAAFYPDINLSAFAGVQAIGLDNLFEASSRTYGAGPAISLPLFKSSQLKASFNAATAAQDESIASYNEAVLRAVQQSADQLSLVHSTAQQLVQARLTLDAAEDAYRLANKRYEAGLANFLSVLATETQVLNARTSYIDVAHAQALARVSLVLALGGDFQPQAL